MWHVLEVVVSLPESRSPAEVVDRDSGVTPLGEAKRELLVEAVQAPDVRKDHDTDVRRLVRQSREGRKAIAVGSVEHEILMSDGPAGDRRVSAATNRSRGT